MIDIQKVTPVGDSVIIKLVNPDSIASSLIMMEHSDELNISTRLGDVISIGDAVNNLAHCPNLNVSEIAVFTEFAGHYIASSDSANIYKVIRGYDIIGKYVKHEDVENKKKLIPTGNRILVEITKVTDVENGIIYNASDPKLADLSYGKVLKVNEVLNKYNLTAGQLVAFPYYAGTTIRNYESADKKELRVIVEEDILFKA
jgi:co-chaperonin GroES (HSP10)